MLQLNNALEQTGWLKGAVTPENWRSVVGARLDAVDWKQAQLDVSPFLEREQDLALVSEDSLHTLLNPPRRS